MDFLVHASLTEDPNAEERGFHEKCQQSLDGKRRAEDVAYIAGIFRPVHTKLEFLNDACDDANGEIDEEQFSPEFCHLAIIFIPRLIVTGLHVCDKPPQPQCKRDKEKMIDSCQSELPA